MWFEQAYGLTEYSCITISHTELYQREPSKKGSVGYILPGTKVKFVELSTGKTVARNTLGEIYAQGPMVMKGLLVHWRSPVSFQDVGQITQCSAQHSHSTHFKAKNVHLE